MTRSDAEQSDATKGVVWIGYEMPRREYFGAHDPVTILAFSTDEAARKWAYDPSFVPGDGAHRTVARCVVDSGVSG